MIPKLVHAIWLGSSKLNSKEEKYVATWPKVLEDYEFYWWTENMDFMPPFGKKMYIPNALQNAPYFKSAYEQKKYAYASDYIRAWVLYNYGGIYMDTDVEVLKSFDPLLDGIILGNEYSGKDIIINGTMGVEKENRMMFDLFMSYNQEFNSSPTCVGLRYGHLSPR